MARLLLVSRSLFLLLLLFIVVYRSLYLLLLLFVVVYLVLTCDDTVNQAPVINFPVFNMQPKPPTPERSFLNVASVSNVCCHVIFVSNFFKSRIE